MSRLSDRLEIEKETLRIPFPHILMFNMYTSNPYAEGSFNTKGGKSYNLRLLFGKHYADKMPELIVVNPKYLYTHDGKRLNDIGCSHFFHTGPTNIDGYVSICHTRSAYWSPSMTAAAVYFKGLCWVTALEAHLKTGRPLCEFVNA